METDALRALVADGQALTRWALKTVLEAERFTVVTAASREEMFGHLLGDAYALVVATCEFGHADVSDLIDRVCEYQRDTAVIVLCAGHLTPIDHRRGHEITVLTKPFDTAAIAQIARRVHDRHPEVLQ